MTAVTPESASSCRPGNAVGPEPGTPLEPRDRLGRRGPVDAVDRTGVEPPRVKSDLKRRDADSYKSLIEKLGLRK